MARALNEITVLEHSRVSPIPNGSLGNKSFPLSYFDFPWLRAHPIHNLFFHDLSNPKSDMIHTTIPKLKHSLSIALQHFFPLSGNLILFPFNDSTSIPKKPEIRYVEGDSVSFIVAESSVDFIYLTKNDPRKANKLYPLVPKLGDLTSNNSDNTKQIPLLAIQVTLFPNNGICIGVTGHHVVGDASAILNFFRVWASVTKLGNDKQFLSSGYLPVFDKSVIKDPNGIGARIWSHIAKTKFQGSPPLHVSGNDDLVRASFTMTKDQINKIKKSILMHRPAIERVSTFTIACAHVWTCMVKARDVVGDQKEQELQFCFLAECRPRLDPPLPTTYFGNCLVSISTDAKHNQLVGEEGFFDGVELIGDAINERLKSKESIDAGLDALMQDFRGFPITVAGSTKFDFYDTDFGWGKPKKHELVSIDYSLTIYINPSRGSEEDIKISLSLPKIQMDVFPTIFTNELKRIIVQF